MSSVLVYVLVRFELTKHIYQCLPFGHLFKYLFLLKTPFLCNTNIKQKQSSMKAREAFVHYCYGFALLLKQHLYGQEF